MTTDTHALFDDQAALYARARPTYPPALLDRIAGLCPDRRLAIDCAAGSGQATLALAERFERVIALDVSAAQLAQLPAHPRVQAMQARAEQTGLPSGCADLILVATALHWLDQDAFWAEALRLLRPGGVVAALSYSGHVIVDDDAMQALSQRYSRQIVGPYWHRANLELARAGAGAPPPPLRPLELGPWAIERALTRQQLVDYLRSWSASARYAREVGQDPILAIAQELERAWPDEASTRQVRWPLSLCVGRTP